MGLGDVYKRQIPPNEQLVIKPGVDIVGSGRRVTFITFPRPDTFHQADNLADPRAALVVAPVGNVSISDIDIRGERIGNPTVGLHIPLRSTLRLTNTSITIGMSTGASSTASVYISNFGILRTSNSHFGSFGLSLQGTYGIFNCLLYTSPSPRDLSTSRMPSSA